MGLLITFEGVEGSGKTTLLQAVGGWLTRLGFPVRETVEPGGTRLGQAVRKLVLEPCDIRIEPVAELLLIEAARAQHVREVLQPALQEGQIVLCDRFSDSTLAYQGYGRGLDPEAIARVNEIGSGGLVPDLTLLLDCEVELGLRRAAARRARVGTKGSSDRIEQEELSFHQRVREGYLAVARRNPKRVRVIPADATEAEQLEKAKEWIRSLLERNSG